MSFPRSSYSGFPFDAESVRDEFPFNRSGSTDANLQSTLNNISQRHPELAEHLNKFGQTAKPKNKTADEFKQKFRRPFGDRSRFPFDDDDLDFDKYTKQFYNPQDLYPEQFQPQTSSYQEQPRRDSNSNPQSSKVEPTESSTKVPGSPKATQKEVNSNLQQSSTTDLGQRQEPIDDRNQRSMSAPPGGDSKKIFTSSINIPINNPPPPSENMAQQNQNQHPDLKRHERIIPIQVEGRDGPPVMPKNPNIPQQTQPQGRSEQIFGQSPDTFTQFVRPNESSFRRGFPEDNFARQSFQNDPFHRQQPQSFHAPKEEVPIPVQKEIPKPSQQSSQQQQQPPTPQQRQQQYQQQQQQYQQQQQQQYQQQQQAPQEQEQPKAEPKKPKSPIEQIQIIQQDVSKLMGDVEQFNGQPKDKEYIYLDEMLTRNLLKLDNIDTQGQENIRSSRKEAIRCIQQAISLLETKAANNVVAPEQKFQSNEEPKDKTSDEDKPKDETSEKPDSNDAKKEETEKMDTEPPKEPVEKMETTVENETRAVLVTEPQKNPEPSVQEEASSASKDSGKEKKEKKDKKGKNKEQ